MRKVLYLMLCATLVAGLAYSQGATTGSLSGTLTDPNGDPIPGVTVVATLTTTATRYATVTDAAGVFRIANVRAGGPYEVVASLAGFKTQTMSDVVVRLGVDTHVEIRLELEAATGEIVVVSESTSLISPTKMGQTSSVSEATIMAMPSVERNIFDSARTNPVFSSTSADTDYTVLSVAGRNPRYNNISIDGAVNNDVFGLANTGTPGGQSGTQPIQIDALQEMQLVTSTFDVRQGGFTGGSVNLITRSGTNQFHGTVFGYYSNDSMVGGGPDYFPEFGTYKDQEYGASIGGPISKDKSFFFVNFGHNDLEQPTGWSLDGVTGQDWQNGCCTQQAEAFQAFNESTYGYDPGGLGELTKTRPSDKFFARVDFNFSEGSTLTARYNYVDAANVLNRPGNTWYEWPNEAYDFKSKTNSLVAQWNAVFGDSKFNELRLTYQTIRDNRTGVGQAFPHIQIQNVDGNRNVWEAGTEQYSAFNSLDTDIFEITDDFTFYMGNHEIVIGTHNEFYSFKNLFIASGFGAYTFTDLPSYYAGIANRYDLTYPNDPNNPADEFSNYQLGLYAGDTWRVKPNLTLIYGLRVDAPFFPDKPEYNPLVEEVYGINTSDVPSGNALWSPRLGFNWDIKGDGIMQLRGGAGLFTGRTPYVWISNNYGNTGTRRTTIRAFGSIPFNPDPYDQPTDIGGASTQEVNAVDPNFDFPQTWRMNLAYDQRLPWLNMVATAEVLYATSQSEINYLNLNIEHSGTELPFDDRPLYSTVNSTFSGLYYLTNTDQGDATNYILKLEKPYGEYPIWGTMSYTYGEANVINDGTSSQASSNWRYHEAFDPNNVSLSASDFQVENRGLINLNYEFSRNTRWSTIVSLFWNRQSGKPYSNIYGYANSASINTDFQTGNDLLYIPSGADDVVITNGTWTQLEAYLERTGLMQYAGGVAPRNATNQPYVTQTDLAIRQNIPIPGDSSLQVSLDIFNFWNIIDSESGLVRYALNGAVSPIVYRGLSADNKPIYELANFVREPDTYDVFQFNDQASRWRVRLGVRWSF